MRVMLLAAVLQLSACVVGEEDSFANEDLAPELVDQVTAASNDPQPFVSDNHVGNGGFEAPVKTRTEEGYQNWVVNGNAARTTSSTAVYEGSYALLVSATSSTQRAMAYQVTRSNGWNPIGGDTYVLEVRAKILRASSRRQRLVIAFYGVLGDNIGSKWIDITEPGTGYGTWKMHRIEIRAPNGTVGIGIGIGKDWTCSSGCGADVVAYDSVKLVSS